MGPTLAGRPHSSARQRVRLVARSAGGMTGQNVLVVWRLSACRYGKVGLEGGCFIVGRECPHVSDVWVNAWPGAVVPRSQTSSPATPHCWRLSPRWSALWAPHCPEPRHHRPELRPHRPEPRLHRPELRLHRPEPRPHRPEPRPRSQQRGELRCERCTVELGPRRGRQQTGGIAAIEVRHAGDTPAGCF